MQSLNEAYEVLTDPGTFRHVLRRCKLLNMQHYGRGMIMAMIPMIHMPGNNTIHSHIMEEEVIHSNSSSNKGEEGAKGSHSKVGKSSSLNFRPFFVLYMYASVDDLPCTPKIRALAPLS